MVDINELARPDTGAISPIIFSDQEVYERELEHLFTRCWIYVGHESLVPNTGDFLLNYMGADEVIVVRDTSRRLHVFLNKCRHRGNKVCFYDRGNARSFTCTYHGWQYDTEGRLFGVPFYEDAYLGELSRETNGLVEVPKVESYKGMIFASWDPSVMPLGDYLGDMQYYLDNLVVHEEVGGIEIVAGKQRYMMPTNWKLLADNFASDNYHTPTTHASAFKVYAEDERMRRDRPTGENFQVAVGYPSGVPHAYAGLRFRPTFDEERERDLRNAEALGPEAVEWVKEWYGRMEQGRAGQPLKVQAGTNSNIFPNLSMITTAGGALEARGIIQWHAKGPLLTEVWQWAAVDKEAPKVVKEAAIGKLMLGQAGAGMIAPDDSENFERSTDNLASHMTKRQPYVYTMGLGFETSHPRQAEWEEAGFTNMPGLIGPWMSEVSQRQYYRYWAQLVAGT